jgi:proline iminopeptidase
MNRATLTTLLGLLVLLYSCTEQRKIRHGEGYVNVSGGKIWYRLTGHNDKIPIVMLHGGPGQGSYYLRQLGELENERPLLYFDQLGCGRSDRIVDTTLMTIENYVEQTKQLLTELNIKEFYLYGHSWGSMLALDYFLKYPNGIKALILASPCLSVAAWQSDADTLLSMFPDSIRIPLEKSRTGIIDDTLEFQAAMSHYVRTYMVRQMPTKEVIDSVSSQMARNVYNYMWGDSEFSVTGTLRNYERIEYLNRIQIPTLYMTGEYDEARPNTVRRYQSLTPDSKLIINLGASHATMFDNPKADIDAISKFLKELEKHAD